MKNKSLGILFAQMVSWRLSAYTFKRGIFTEGVVFSKQYSEKKEFENTKGTDISLSQKTHKTIANKMKRLTNIVHTTPH